MNEQLARDLVRGLSAVELALKGVLEMTVRSATASDIYQPFIGAAIAGTTAVTIWTPNAGRRFVLRGFAITAIVRDVLVAAKPGTLYFHDSSSSTTVIAPVGSFDATAAAGTIITGSAGPFMLDLGSGVRGKAVDTTLKLAASLDIGAGVIRYCGAVWGVEETA
jgi:hypothetical protein